MDQKKIGAFLKQLRKEKNLTQEQLAEKMLVSSRTVSRWETGSNMPDISILIELADYYEIDIRELINGERKSETMTEETRDVLNQVAEYTDAEKKKILKNVLIYSVCVLACLMLGFTVFKNEPADASPIYSLMYNLVKVIPPMFTLYTIWDVLKLNGNMGKHGDSKTVRIVSIVGIILGLLCIAAVFGLFLF